MSTISNRPRRGEIWHANTGGKRHTVVIISLNQRNISEHVDSVLVVPFSSGGSEGPTTLQMQPGETGLPEPSYLKAHYISVIKEELLTERLPRVLSDRRLREVVAMVNRAIDPDAPFDK